MEHASRFIVLGITKIGDSSIVVHTLSPGWGRRSFIVSASRKLSGSLLQPLSIVNGEVSENPKSELWRLHGMSLDEPLTGIRTDLHKNSMTMFMSEVLFRTLREGEGGEDLFDWCRRSILTLDALKSDFANYHLRFLLELAVQLGFSPSIDDLAPFAGESYGVVKRFLQSSAAESMLIPMNGTQRSDVASILLDYLAFHTESRLEIRSLGVLRELYK